MSQILDGYWKTFRSIMLMSSVAAFCAAGASAMTTLKQVQVSNGSQIDLLFDGKVGQSQVRTEFFNDVIQISLNEVSVYPAKISSINGGALVKIFAYQYAPKLVRCRLTVNGKAEDFKDRLQVSANGKVLSLKLADTASRSDRIALQAAHPTSAPKADAAKKAAVTQVREGDEKTGGDETALLSRVMAAAAPSKPVAVVAAANAQENQAPRERAGSSDNTGDDERKTERRSERRTERLALGGAKPLPSPMGVLGKLMAVIALFGAMAFVAKKFLHGRSGSRALNARIARGAVSDGGWLSALGGMAKSAASGLGRKEKMIEVLSNHHLGPKKSIAVVRVMGRTLVLGVSNEAINLISEISEDGMEAEIGDLIPAREELSVAPRAAAAPKVTPTLSPRAASAAYAGFSDLLNVEAKKPATSAGAVRNQIRSRLEGLKQL